MNPMTQPSIFIKCEDDSGDIQELSCKEWSKITGKAENLIRIHYKKKIEGKINITDRETVGLDDIKWQTVNKRTAGTKKAYEKSQRELSSDFLKRRLVGGLR